MSKRYDHLKAKFGRLVKKKAEIGNKFLIDSQNISKEIKVVRDQMFELEPHTVIKKVSKQISKQWDRPERFTEDHYKMFQNKISELNQILEQLKNVSTKCSISRKR